MCSNTGFRIVYKCKEYESEDKTLYNSRYMAKKKAKQRMQKEDYIEEYYIKTLQKVNDEWVEVDTSNTN